MNEVLEDGVVDWYNAKKSRREGNIIAAYKRTNVRFFLKDAVIFLSNRNKVIHRHALVREPSPGDKLVFKKLRPIGAKRHQATMWGYADNYEHARQCAKEFK